MSKRKILITGGLGYVGGRVAQHLVLQTDYEIVLGSRHKADPPGWLPQSRVLETLWSSSDNLKQNCSGIDSVVHLAGMNAQDCFADPVAALEFNAVGTARLLQAAINQGVKRFIYLSTAHVYGSPLEGTITEATCPVNLHPYASSQRAGEDVVLAAHQRGEIAGVVLRLSNAFGAPANMNANCWMLLVNDLCRQAVTTGKLVLRSSGLQRRDFITLEDVSRAVEYLLEMPVESCADGLFNLGGECSLQIIELTKRISSRCKEILDFSPDIVIPKPECNEVSAELAYRIDKLKSTGFTVTGNINAEIDATLLLCRESFGRGTC